MVSLLLLRHGCYCLLSIVGRKSSDRDWDAGEHCHKEPILLKLQLKLGINEKMHRLSGPRLAVVTQHGHPSFTEGFSLIEAL